MFVEQLDPATVVGDSQMNSSEAVRRKVIETLLRTTVQHAGAERAVLLLLRGGEATIEAEATTDRVGVTVHLREAGLTSVEVPETLVDSVIRTHESVILDDASAARGPFSADPYISRTNPRSVLCLPLLSQTVLMGAIYLENRLAPCVFSPSRIDVLRLLAAQAATSLETARLYHDVLMENAELKRSHQAVSDSGARFEGFLDIAEDAFISVDSTQRIVLFNHGAERIFGYAQAEVIGRPLEFLLPRRFDKTHRDLVESFARSPDVARQMGQRREVCGRRMDGREFPAEVSISKLDLGGTQVFTAILRDITERKESEEKLRQSEAFLAEAQRLSRTGSFGRSVPTGEIIWSEETYRILGLPRDVKPTVEFVFERVHPEDRHLVRETLDRVSRDGANLDLAHRLLMPDGSIKYVHVLGRHEKTRSGTLQFFGAIMDVTAEKRSQQTLERSLEETQALKDQLRLAIDTIPALAWSSQPDGACDFLNHRWLEFAGFSLEQALGWGWTAAVHPEDISELTAVWRRAFATGKAAEMEARLRRFDGEHRWFLFRAVPLVDQHGSVVKWYGTTTDIEDRKRAEALLAGEKRILERIARGDSLAQVLDAICQLIEGSFPSLLASVLLFDAAGKSVHGAAPSLPSSYAKALEGWPIDPASGPCGHAAYYKKSVLADFDSPEWASFRDRLSISTYGLRGVWSTPILSSKDTVLGTFAIYSREVFRPSPWHESMVEQITHLAAVALEHTRTEAALDKLRSELAHVTRIASLGQLTASIAHEVNQPLAGVVMNGNACLRWLTRATPNVDEAREAARRIVRDGNRAGEVITRLRELFKKTGGERTPLDMNAVVSDVVALTRGELRANGVVLRVDLAQDLRPLVGSRVQLQQVILNLIVNAVEAMRTVHDRPRELSIVTGAESDLLRVTVKDSGTGLDPGDMDRLFDAFYTNKDGGMGMGLSISRSIIESHGGVLWAEPPHASGATFVFTIPLGPSQTL